MESHRMLLLFSMFYLLLGNFLPIQCAFITPTSKFGPSNSSQISPASCVLFIFFLTTESSWCCQCHRCRGIYWNMRNPSFRSPSYPCGKFECFTPYMSSNWQTDKENAGHLHNGMYTPLKKDKIMKFSGNMIGLAKFILIYIPSKPVFRTISVETTNVLLFTESTGDYSSP